MTASTKPKWLSECPACRAGVPTQYEAHKAFFDAFRAGWDHLQTCTGHEQNCTDCADICDCPCHLVLVSDPITVHPLWADFGKFKT